MLLGPNALLIVGADSTVRETLALGDPAVVVWVVVTPEVLLGNTPVVLLVTLNVTVQPLVGMLIPVKVSGFCARFTLVPVHVPPKVPATALMLVSVSVKDPPLSAEALLLDSVSVTVDVPPV